MGYLEVFVYNVGYRLYTAVYQPQSLVLSVLIALVEQQLHTEAYAHHGLALGGFALDYVSHAGSSELFGGVLKGAYSRQDDAFG